MPSPQQHEPGPVDRRAAPLIQRSAPVRWPVLIAELQDAGYSLREIGAAIGVPHTTVNAWAKPVMRRGELQGPSFPMYEDGKALLELHQLLKPTIDVEFSKRRAAQVVRDVEQPITRID